MRIALPNRLRIILGRGERIDRSSPFPIRGVWIANRPHSQALSSRDCIYRSLEFIKSTGLNTVFPVVWNRDHTLFQSRVMEEYGFSPVEPFYRSQNFDPLAVLSEAARELDLKVIPWFEYGFAAYPGGPILSRKPDWRALDKTGGPVNHGGLTWMNALDGGVQEFILSLMLEVVRNYDVDGVQGCDRLPALPVAGGYNPGVIQRYQRETGIKNVPGENDPRWIGWRADRLTDFLALLYGEVKSINRELIVSLSPAVYPFSLNHLLQDVPGWIKRGVVDYLHPQIYRDKVESYRGEAKKLKGLIAGQSSIKVAPGIAFTANGRDLETGDIRECLRINRELGFDGYVCFHYEGLRKDGDRVAGGVQFS